MAIKITYGNSCIPQERVDLADGTERWYLDSDSSKKMSGKCEPTVTIATTYYGTSTLAASGSITLESSTTVNFAFVKNTGENDKTVALASTLGTNYEYFLGKD
jgi:hypothetical protein